MYQKKIIVLNKSIKPRLQNHKQLLSNTKMVSQQQTKQSHVLPVTAGCANHCCSGGRTQEAPFRNATHHFCKLDHRLSWIARDPEDHPVPILCYDQGTFHPQQAAESCAQPEPLQGQGTHSPTDTAHSLAWWLQMTSSPVFRPYRRSALCNNPPVPARPASVSPGSSWPPPPPPAALAGCSSPLPAA